MEPIAPIPIEDIRAAQRRVADLALRSPLLPLVEGTGAEAKIHLKLENLQPIGSFKLRGAGNAIGQMTPSELERGVYTASAGNMAQGAAFVGGRLGIETTVVVPDHAPRAKLDAVERFGAKIIKIPFDKWWEVLESHHFDGLDATFLHPVSEPRVIAGNGTIGLEILEDRPDVEAIIVPYGGGGLSCGIACAAKAMRPDIKIYAAEVETAAPFHAALEAGEPVRIEYQASFVDGIGSGRVLDEMWPLARRMLNGSLVVSLEMVAETIRLLAERYHVIAEGAGAASLAAARAGLAPHRSVACVISGGNIDATVLSAILKGKSLGTRSLECPT